MTNVQKCRPSAECAPECSHFKGGNVVNSQISHHFCCTPQSNLSSHFTNESILEKVQETNIGFLGSFLHFEFLPLMWRILEFELILFYRTSNFVSKFSMRSTHVDFFEKSSCSPLLQKVVVLVQKLARDYNYNSFQSIHYSGFSR